MPRIVSIVLLAALLVPLAACQPGDVAGTLPAGSVDYCTIMADPPVKDGSKIDAPGRYRCDGSGADKLTITVTLQKKAADGSWSAVKSQTFTVYGKNTSRARTEGTRTRRVFAPCAKGKFRTVVHSVEKSDGHSQPYDTHSVTVPNPCTFAF